MSMSVMRLATMLSDDAVDRKSRHKRVPLITIIDSLGMNVGTFYEIRPEDMYDMLLHSCNYNEQNSEVIDIIRDPSDERSNLIDRNIIIRCKWPINSKVHKWSNDSKHSTKTRQDVFLEHYPKSLLDDDGVVFTCPRNIDNMFVCNWRCPGGCNECRHEYWTQKADKLN